MTFTPER